MASPHPLTTSLLCATRALIRPLVCALLLIASVALAPASASAQTLTSGPTTSSPYQWDGLMFDVVAQQNIVIEGIDHHLGDGAHTVEVWTRAGTYVGFTESQTGWTRVGVATVTSAGVGAITTLPITMSLSVNAGSRRAFYVTATDGSFSRYKPETIGAVGDVAVSDASLQIMRGESINYPFATANLRPRVWEGAIRYRPQNQPPTLGTISAQSGFEDVLKTVAFTVSDPDTAQGSLSFTLTSSNQSVVANAGLSVTGTTSNRTLRIQPVAHASGSTTITVRVSDGVNTVQRSFVYTITAVNDAPSFTAGPDVVVEEDSGFELLSGWATNLSEGPSDESAQSLTFTVTVDDPSLFVDQPYVSPFTGSLWFEPAPNASGVATITITLSDDGGTANGGVDTSASITRTITITPLPDAPIASPASVTTDEDVPSVITLPATDPEGDPITYTYTQPAHGTVTGAGPDVTYTPHANYNGVDSFTFTAADATGSSTATISITITPQPDPPVAAPIGTTTAEDTAKRVTLVGLDPDGDAMTFSYTQPAHGTVTGGGPDVTYTPDENYHGQDSFTYTVSDGTSTSAPATVTITVTPVNDAPVASAVSVSGAEDSAIAVTLNASDADGDSLTYAITTPPAHGTLSGTGSARTYTPDANYNGTDSFTYTARDGALTSAPATVTITITPVNDAPAVADSSATTAEEAPVTLTLDASDVDGDALTITLGAVQPSGAGTISGMGTTRVFTPARDFNGAASFTFTAGDGTVTSASATVTITVTPVNDAPVATNDAITAVEDTPATFDPRDNDADADGDALTVTITATPSHGSAAVNADGTITYTPAADFNGQDALTYQIADPSGASSEALVAITVTPANDAPVFVAPTPNAGAQIDAPEGVALVLTVAADDADGDALTYTIEPTPAGATFDVATGRMTWTPTWEQAGTSTHTLKASDGQTEVTRVITIVSTFTDADADGLPDTWEVAQSLDPTTADSDGDTISDLDEVGDDLDSPRDTDGAGEIDALSSDSDGDGIPDAEEAGDDDLSTAPVDTDGDGTPDYRDTDSDDDGVEDDQDVCPTVEDPQQLDTDGDGLGDACEDDTDGDGVPDEVERALNMNPLSADSDGDTIADGDEVGDDLSTPANTDGAGEIDALSNDADGDGILDIDEAGDADLSTPPVDTDGDGVPDYQDTDSDDDGVLDGQDVCPTVADPKQLDTDGDGLGDACADDADGDGVLNDADNCPLVANAGQEDADADGEGDACDADDDNDGVADDADTCPLVANGDQEDTDGDGLGDACDDDDDNDGVIDTSDNCPLLDNADQKDTDGNGEGDACDPEGAYVPPAEATGCGCRTVPAPRQLPALPWALGLLVGAVWRVRRRRA